MEMEDLVSSHFMLVESEPQWRKTEATIRKRDPLWSAETSPILCPLPCASCSLPCAPCLLHSLLSICNAFSPSPQFLTPFTAVLIHNLLHKTLWTAPSVSYFIIPGLWLHHHPSHGSKYYRSFLPAFTANPLASPFGFTSKTFLLLSICTNTT